MKRISYLDGWRGLAIVGVLIDHYITSNGINLGRFGVEFFFVLSGRLMGEILFVDRAELKAFFLRRISRIYPALLICMTLTLFLGVAMNKETIFQYLTTVTLTYNYAQFWTGRWASIDHVWSLCIEEHMYLLLGAVAYLSRRFKLSAMAIAMSLAFLFILNGLISTSLGYVYDQVYWRSDVRGASILLGAGLYLLLRGDRFKAIAENPITTAVALLLAIMMNLNSIPDPIKYSLGTFSLAVAVASLPSARNVTGGLSWKPLAFVGTISYSLYLYQQVFALVLHNGAKKLNVNDLALAPVVLVIVFIVALASYYFIEKPSRLWLNKVFHLGRPPAIS